MARMSADGSIAVTVQACPAQITAERPVPAPRSTTSGAPAPDHCLMTWTTLAGGRGRAASYSLAKPVNRDTASGIGWLLRCTAAAGGLLVIGRPAGLARRHALPRAIAISRSSTRPLLTRSPSCSYSFVTHARRPRIVAPVRTEYSRGTYMSS